MLSEQLQEALGGGMGEEEALEEEPFEGDRVEGENRQAMASEQPAKWRR